MAGIECPMAAKSVKGAAVAGEEETRHGRSISGEKDTPRV